MLCFKLTERIRFYFRSQTAHGIHSPFVYNLYNQIKSSADNYQIPASFQSTFSSKQGRILKTIFQVLKINKTLVIDDKADDLKAFLRQIEHSYSAVEIKDLSKISQKFDLIILSKSLLISKKLDFSTLTHLVFNHSLVIIPHIHASKQAIMHWNTLIKKKTFTVSIDLFFVGLLFFRKESSKQDFTLRI